MEMGGEERKRSYVPSGSVLGSGHFTISLLLFFQHPEIKQKACFLGSLDGREKR